MEIVYEQHRYTELQNMLHPKFKFEAPGVLHTTRDDYLEALRSNPPANEPYHIIKFYENPNSACLIYRYGKKALICQTFEINEGKISQIKLIYNPAEF
jgi:hypothetical protein